MNPFNLSHVLWNRKNWPQKRWFDQREKEPTQSRIQPNWFHNSKGEPYQSVFGPDFNLCLLGFFKSWFLARIFRLNYGTNSAKFQIVSVLFHADSEIFIVTNHVFFSCFCKIWNGNRLWWNSFPKGQRKRRDYHRFRIKWIYWISKNRRNIFFKREDKAYYRCN